VIVISVLILSRADAPRHEWRPRPHVRQVDSSESPTPEGLGGTQMHLDTAAALAKDTMAGGA